MPDTRSHRGPHPGDAELFAPATHGRLREAVGDYSWLLERGYAEPSALKLVGDRLSLSHRQRMAVRRASCSDSAVARRRVHQAGTEELRGRRLLIDGYNVLTTIEAALSGGVILIGRDGCCRDLASMHGTFRVVQETRPALRLLGSYLQELGPACCVWYLDTPVSNSGRLRGLMLELAGDERWQWDVQLVPDPDRVLAGAGEIVATADSVVLDRCARWFNLTSETLRARLPHVPTIDLAS